MKLFIFQKILSKAIQTALLFFHWKRKIVYANLHYVFPEYSEHKINQVYQELLFKISKTAAEFLLGNQLYRKLPEKFENYPFNISDIQFDIHEDSKNCIEKMKRGGLLLTAHFGNYEAIGPWLCKLGIPLQASYAKIKPNFLNQFVEKKLRAVNGKSYTIFVKNPKQILKLISEKKLFCLVADQDYRKKSGVQELLFNKEVSCNPIPNFIFRHHPNTPIFTCWIEEKNHLRTLYIKELETSAIYKSFHNNLEELIYSQLSSWYGWTHRRFIGTKNKYTIYQQFIKHL